MKLVVISLLVLVCVVAACHGNEGAEHAAGGGAPAPVLTPPPPAPVIDATVAPAIDAALPVDASLRPDAAIKATKLFGKHGDVCSYGARHVNEGNTTPSECGPGLQCCYPCGIQGCDSVCHTPDECNMDRRRPSVAPRGPK